MEIQTVKIADIKRAKYNPRVALTPKDPEYKRLAKGIEKFGLVELPIWNKRSGNLGGGHQRLTILEARGDVEVKVSVVDLNDRDEKTLNIGLNKLGGRWDDRMLGDLLKDLNVDGFDLDLTGLSLDDLARLAPVNFGPADAAAQGKLDQQTPIKCPHCGEEFIR
jgi:ParB-like chromosome segregation protein Spo0J